ncbi:uncharacterized protein MKK02DRAFT_32711 [Dioszegia hungarica]|uniref:C2H2-type domain-containing protein n=1 Tax=Dioszegia hungarica TaxID=4972 RepID=A0AA38H6W6_9TREE|nr:uncharacterized protein MKK02DRAFT_32711 [Dioszegia hungarica]KAI9635245.1 hypothetical protein MKK02DRAFT_32711 [Dioszegia hungarica]
MSAGTLLHDPCPAFRAVHRGPSPLGSNVYPSRLLQPRPMSTAPPKSPNHQPRLTPSHIPPPWTDHRSPSPHSLLHRYQTHAPAPRPAQYSSRAHSRPGPYDRPPSDRYLPIPAVRSQPPIKGRPTSNAIAQHGRFQIRQEDLYQPRSYPPRPISRGPPPRSQSPAAARAEYVQQRDPRRPPSEYRDASPDIFFEGYGLSKGAQRDAKWRSKQQQRDRELAMEAQYERMNERNRAELAYREQQCQDQHYQERREYAHQDPHLREHSYAPALPDHIFPRHLAPLPHEHRPSSHSMRADPTFGFDACSARRSTAVSVHKLGVAPGVGLSPPHLDERRRLALLREQEAAINAARKGLADAATRRNEQVANRNRRAETVTREADTEAARLRVEREHAKEDPARRRRIQLQVFVHARPTYCRWGPCRAVLNSWGLLEKHILQAHIKPLAAPLRAPSIGLADGGKSKKAEYGCHWGDCNKGYLDKERMYRHALVEHMGEFCARCPFDCLFEGPTFPSLMAHISRRHPLVTPDDFVPGLIHFEPPSHTPPPLPEDDTVIRPIPPYLLPGSHTPVVLPYYGEPSRSKSGASQTSLKVRVGRVSSLSSEGSVGTMTRSERSRRAKDALGKRVAGRVISEVVRRAVAGAAAIKSDTAEPLGGRPSPTSGAECNATMDVKAIAKQMRAAIKLESAAQLRGSSSTPFSPPTSPTRAGSTRGTLGHSIIASSDGKIDSPIDIAAMADAVVQSISTGTCEIRPSARLATPPVPGPASRSSPKSLASAQQSSPSPASNYSSSGSSGVPDKDPQEYETGDLSDQRLKVKVESARDTAEPELMVPSPSSDLKIRLKLPRGVVSGVKRELEEEDTAQNESEGERLPIKRLRRRPLRLES